MKKTNVVRKVLTIVLILIMYFDCFSAIVSDNDGSAFVTKAEFDALKNNFNKQIDDYNSSIDGKIDGAIASYLSGIKMSKTETIEILSSALSSDGYIYSLKHKDLGFTSGYPDLNITYNLAASTTIYGGASAGWLAARTHSLFQSYSSPDDASHDSEFGKRLYLETVTSGGSTLYYYDGLYKVKDSISLKNFYDTTTTDVGFNHDGTITYRLSVLTSHNTNDTNLSLNTWASNLYWIVGPLVNTDSSASHQRLYKNTSYDISVNTNKLRKVYGAVILNEAVSTDTYPYWNSDDSKLSTNWQQVSSTTQNAAHNNLYYVTIETMWPKLSYSQNISVQAAFVDNTKWTSNMNIPVATVGSYDNERERKNYTNRCWPLRKYNDMILLENVYQGDKSSYSYKDDAGTAKTINKYKLNDGIPFAVAENDWKFVWTPKFVKNTATSVAVACTPEFSYGPFSDATSESVTGVTYDSISGKYSFTSTKNALIFVRWPNGSALDIENSKQIQLIKPE